MAQLGLEQPSLDEFILRGTIPVPKSTFPAENGMQPFGIVDADGSVVPAQVEIVSRYPSNNKGADVVELTARVHRKSGIAVGERATYDVVLAEHATPAVPDPPTLQDLADGPAGVPQSVADLVTTPGSILITAEDVFGHLYTLDPLAGVSGMKWTRYGDCTAQLRTYGAMVPGAPDPGPSGTLPHLFGVHAYASTWSGEELLGLDLRFNNGADGFDKSSDLDDPLGKFYFKYVHVLVPNGWLLEPDLVDPSFGDPFIAGNFTVFPLVEEIGNGDLHVMPSNGQFHRRLMIAPLAEQDRAQAYLAQEGLAFARPGHNEEEDLEYWSWWNPSTARYFPQRQQLPDLAHLGDDLLLAEIASDYAWLLDHFEAGTGYGAYPLAAANLGWAHPYGVAYGGATGGDEIHFYTGVRTVTAASALGIQNMLLTHRMQTDRQPNAYYNVFGQPSSLEQWLNEDAGGQDYIEMIFYGSLLPNEGDPMGYDEVPTFQVDAVATQGRKPSYEGALLGFKHHDIEHMIRYTRLPKALAWLANDALGKDDLRMQAEVLHLSYNSYYNDQYGKFSGFGITKSMDYIAEHGPVGFPVGRADGWTIDTMNAAYSLADPDWRAAKFDWFKEVADVMAAGQSSCSGFLQALVSPKFLDSKYRGRQSIEAAILENGLHGSIESVFRGRSATYVDVLEDVLEDSYYAMVSPMSWAPGQFAPWAYAAVGPKDESLPPWCSLSEVPTDGNSGNHDGYQIWSSLAYAYELTGDTLFLTMSEQALGGSLLGELEDQGTTYLENRIPILTVAQDL